MLITSPIVWEPKINEGPKAWRKSPFVTITNAFTQAFIFLFFLPSIIDLTFTCACKIKLLACSFEFCVVWGMTRLFQFFSVFSLRCIISSVFFFPKLYLKKKKRNIYLYIFIYRERDTKEIPVFVGCKFLLIKGDGQLDTHRQTSVGLWT